MEAIANIRTGVTHALAYGLIMFAFMSGLTAWICTETGSLVAAAVAFQASGASTHVITAPHSIDGRRCDALIDLPGVSAAGATRQVPKLVARALPSSGIPTFEGTAGFTRLLAPERDLSAGALVSDDLADELTAGLPTTLATAAGPINVGTAFTYPSDGRRSGYGYAIVLPTSSHGKFDECWVSIWPYNPDSLSRLQSVVLAPGSAPSGAVAETSLTQLNTSYGVDFAGSAQYAARLSRAAPLLAIIVGFGLGLQSVHARRLQVAQALHFGIRRSAVSAILSLEVGAWALGSFGAVAVAVLWSSAISEDDRAAVMTSVLLTCSAGFLGPLCGALVALAFVSEARFHSYARRR